MNSLHACFRPVKIFSSKKSNSKVHVISRLGVPNAVYAYEMWLVPASVVLLITERILLPWTIFTLFESRLNVI